MRVYVANLEAYNNGELDGKWFEPALYESAEDFEAAVRDIVLHGRDIDYAIHDFDGFYGLRLSEYESLSGVWEGVNAVADTCDTEAFLVWAHDQNLTIGELSEHVDRFRDAYIGTMTALDYAYDYVEECIFDPSTPEVVKNYFNYEAFARDLKMGGDVYELTGPGYETFLFSAHV